MDGGGEVRQGKRREGEGRKAERVCFRVYMAMRRVTLGLGLAAAVVVALVVGWRFFGDGDDPGGELVVRLEGGTEVWTGELDVDAYREAQAVTDLPMLWLGEEFEGYALTHMQVHANVWLLVYGDCQSGSRSEPSCLSPIQIQMRPKGGIPGNLSGPGRFRGVNLTAGESGHGDPGTDSAVVWLPGGSTAKVYVWTYVTGDITDRLMQALRSSNHDAMGYAEVGPGESLAGMP